MKYLSVSLLICANFILSSCETQKKESSNTKATVVVMASVQTDNTEEFIGAWTTTLKNKEGNSITATAIFVDTYVAVAFSDLEDKRFEAAVGGSWSVTGNNHNLYYEFHSSDSTMVGKTVSRAFKLGDDKITFEDNGDTWTKIDDGKPGVLAGAYLITGRKRDGEITKITPGARKTMKILSGTRFQWIAYNTETAQFSGTGGGTYTTIDGKYTETIEFFSKDNGRVGAILPFNYEIVDGEWHHSGLSSKGDPIYELWTPRKMLDKTVSN